MSATPIPLPTETHAEPEQKDTTLALPSELLDHAIDRQRMGNNLYAIGAYELALKNYEMMLKELTGDAVAAGAKLERKDAKFVLGTLDPKIRNGEGRADGVSCISPC